MSIRSPIELTLWVSKTGVKVVHDLYLESLTEGLPAATYIDMMKHNVSSIVEALK